MLSDSDSLDDILLPPVTTPEATLPDSDSLDSFLLPATTTDRTLGKFRPKPRLKAIKQVPATSNPSDAPQLLSSISKPPPAPVRKCAEEGSILPTSGVIGLSTSSPDLHVVEEFANQRESLDSEALTSNGDHVEVSLSGQENSGQDADTFFGMESLDDNIQPALTTVRAVGRFQPKANSRIKDNKLVTPRNAVPGCADSVHASTSSCSSSALDPGYSELNLTHEPVHVTEEPVVHTEASNDGAHVSGSDANLETDPASQDGSHVFESNASIETDPVKSVAEATAVFDCMESPDDTLFHPSATSERALGKFRPKLHPKITKSIPASSNSDATQIISPFLEPLPHASDVKCLEEGSSLSSSFTTGSSTLKTRNSEIHVTQESVNHLEASLLILNGDNAEASHGDQGKLGEVADMFFSMESLDDDIQHASPTVRAVGTFPIKKKKLISPSNAVPGVEESVGVSNLSSSSSAPLLISSKLNATQEPLNITKESSIHEEACQDGPQVSESDGNLQTIPDKPQEEAMTVLSGIESLDDIVLQNSATAVKQVGKFHPKIVSRSKERKAKSVSFILPDAAETVAPPEEFHSCNSTGADPSFLEMMSDGFLDKTPQSSSVISDCSVDFHWDHGRMGKEDTAEFSGFESLDNILSQPTSSTDRSVGKFQPKPSGKTKIVKPSASLNSHGATESISSQLDSLPEGIESMEGHDLGIPADSLVHSVTWDCNSMPTDLAHDQADHFETSTLKAPSPGSSDGLQTIIRTLGRDNYIGGKRKLSTVSNDIGNGVQSQNVEELTQQILDERSSSKSVEDGVSKSSRKLRKRVVVCSPSGKVDGGTSEDWDVENSNISEMDEDHSDDEYRGKDMPMQKRAPKKSKRQMTENHKPIQRRKKASEEPDSTKQEPPKKKFPHGTRRKRRQVDKVLLEMPEYEIDPKQLKIKDLIMLAEAKERISSKEAAALRTSQSNTGSFPNDTSLDQDNLFGEEQDPNLDGDEAHRNMLRNSTKLNYHSYMNRPQSGRWSKSETELFYQAIRQFGTDFAMIQQLFPNRTRHQVKLKFKNEERKHPLQVADAIIHRSKDHSHFERVIQQLQAQAEQNSIDANDDPTTVSKDAADGNEDERGEPEKEEKDANGFEGEADNSVQYNNWDEDGQGPSHFNGYEGVFEWDANASSPQDMEKYTFYDEL